MSAIETGVDRSAAFKLEITAECPFVEIAVFDSRLQLIDQRLGHAELDLKPGLYKIRYSTGDAFRDEYAPLVDQDSALTGPIVPVYSPAPFHDSTTYDESDAQIAASLTERAGFGRAGVGVFFGMLRGSGAQKSSSVRAMLLRPTGEIASVLAPGETRDVGPSWCAAAAELPHGTYVLQITDGTRTIEQAVVLTSETQTQVFIVAANDERSESRTRPAPEPAIFVGQKRPFDPQSTIARWTETVRRRLSKGLDLPVEEAIRSFARSSVTPDLGLVMVVLHLCVRSSEPRMLLDLFRRIANAIPYVALHPDLAILRADHGLGAGSFDGAQLRWPVPPMLSSTWRMIVDRSADDPSCIPFGSTSARVAWQIFTDGAWLAWQGTPPGAVKPASHNKPHVVYDLEVVDIEDYAERLLARLPPSARPDLAKIDDRNLADERAQIVARRAMLDPFERWIFDAMLRLGAARLRGGDEASQSPAKLRRDFVRRFGSPAVLLGHRMATLEAKLDALPSDETPAKAVRRGKKTKTADAQPAPRSAGS